MNVVYYVIHVLAATLFVVFNVFYGRHFNLDKRTAAAISLFGLITSYGTLILLTWISNGFTKFGAQNAVRVFAVYPLYIWLATKIFHKDYETLSDFLAICPMIFYGVGHYACLIPGCCASFRFVEGSFLYRVAYALTGTDMLPQQFIEATEALLIALVVYLVARRKNFKTNGKMFFVMLIAYGISRTIFEFFRDNHKLIAFGKMPGTVDGVFGISNLALWSISMFIVGVVGVCVLNRKHKKATTA